MSVSRSYRACVGSRRSVSGLFRRPESVAQRANQVRTGYKWGVRRVVIVDGANVVGSVPDGWWRDRAGAAERLRDALAAADLDGEIVLVVEGQAAAVTAVAGVRVVSSPGVGDDTIVDLVEAEVSDRPVFVVTADRGLQARVRALGAEVTGPTELRTQIGYGRK